MPDGSTTGTVARVLFLHAQTGLHPGSGTALGTVDLPVQRERHTQWPIIPGSSLKGVARDACRRRSGNTSELLGAFGPDVGEVDKADKHAGALSLTDARILAFPVRSLCGVFAWVTCHAVLSRLQRDLSLFPGAEMLPTIPQPVKTDAGDQAFIPEASPLLVDGNKLVLEEFEFVRGGDSAEIARWIGGRAVRDEGTRKRIEKHLVVLHDDDFKHFVRHATEVVARVGLDATTKTVKQGALFYQEFLPAETIFYALVLANGSRREGDTRGAAAMIDYLASHLPPVLQIGGDETTGKGLCAVRFDATRGK